MKFKVVDMYGKPGYMNPMMNYTNKCKCGNKKQFSSKNCKKCFSLGKNAGVSRLFKSDKRREKERKRYILNRITKFGKPYSHYNVQVYLPLIKFN